MKKITSYLFIISVVLFLVSCGASKEAGNYEQSINGTWQLETIVSEGITGKYNARIFDEQDFNCFIGSSWKFNRGNNLGNYTIAKNGGECVAVKRDFRWSIYQPAKGAASMLQFKKLTANLKEMDNDAGYRFTILNADKNNMRVRSEFLYEGRAAAFIYNFIKM